MSDEPPPPSYWDYLKLDRLLALQGGLEDDESSLLPDELHFIIVHQAYELWFKLILRELRLGRDALAQPRVAEEQVPHVVHHLRRAAEIMRLLVQQFSVMETLTPQDFLAFRDKLVPASGFQSFQMREMEILLGLADEDRTRYLGRDPLDHIRGMTAGSPGGDAAWERITRARQEVTLRTALSAWLHRTPIQGTHAGTADDQEVVLRFLESYLGAQRGQHAEQIARLARAGAEPASARAQLAEAARLARRFLMAEDRPELERAVTRRVRAGLLFIETYRELPLLAWPRLLIDTVVDLEEQLVLFRHRHARMVERVIGRRMGTGGSTGVEYLDATTHHRIFDDLWQVRTQLLPKEHRPPLENAGSYGFRSRAERGPAAGG